MVGRKISRCHHRTSVTKEGRVLESDNRIISLCTLEELAYMCADYFVLFPPVPIKVTPLVGCPILVVCWRKSNRDLGKPPMTVVHFCFSEFYQERLVSTGLSQYYHRERRHKVTLRTSSCRRSQ